MGCGRCGNAELLPSCALNAAIPSVEVETGSFQFGPTISKDFILNEGGVLSTFIKPEIIWNFEQSNTATSFVNEAGIADEGVRGRIEGGFRATNATGGNTSLSVNYDGIGDNDFSSWGIRIGLRQHF